MLELVRGRPQDAAGRLARETRVYDLLDSLGIEYERIDHEAAFTMEACEAIDRALGTLICKNLFLCNKQETRFYLLMIPGSKVFKTKDLSRQIGSSRLSFAPPEAMEKYLDVTPGSVSVMGLMNDHDHHVQLLVDRDVLCAPTLGCHPCVNTSSLRLGMRDVTEVFLPAVGHEMIVVDLPPHGDGGNLCEAQTDGPDTAGKE